MRSERGGWRVLEKNHKKTDSAEARQHALPLEMPHAQVLAHTSALRQAPPSREKRKDSLPPDQDSWLASLYT